MEIFNHRLRLHADPSRVVVRPFHLGWQSNGSGISRSQRLIGLDATNDNALARAIVVHSAWYANKDMLRTHGMLGRSQGCFAVGESDLSQVFAQLGQGRMIFSAKV